MWHNGRRAKQPGFIHSCTRSRTHFQTVTNHADKYEGLIQSKILLRVMKIGRFNKHRLIVDLQQTIENETCTLYEGK